MRYLSCGGVEAVKSVHKNESGKKNKQGHKRTGGQDGLNKGEKARGGHGVMRGPEMHEQGRRPLGEVGEAGWQGHGRDGCDG